MLKNIIFLFISVIFIFCGKETSTPKPGQWRASFLLDKGREIPFSITYSLGNTITISNAEEKIIVNDVTIKEDSIIIRMPIFEGVFKGVFTETTIKGAFIKPSLDRVVAFEMRHGNSPRFSNAEKARVQVGGNWETVFSPDVEADRYIAKGIFEQIGNNLTGTFRTTTGDYRYLEGVVFGDSLKLSTFDGSHVFLFEAEIKDDIMNGVFFSGNHFKEPFTAKRNNDYELPAAESLTFLKEGFERFDFSFPDTEGNLVSLEDAVYKNKVVIVQVMGSWCPNCLDETKFYTKYYNENKNEHLEMVALAFEYASTKEKAISSIKRLVEGVKVPYRVLLAQYGSSSKVEANEKLPMLNHVLSYPTTIFIDKTGVVRRIHTGFNGPATGEKYYEFVNEFESYVRMLTEE